MLKPAIVAIQLVGLLFLSMLLGETIRIEQNLPTSMAPGEEKVIAVKLTKGSVQGFAKYQLTVSPQVEVSMVDGKGASFTFSNGKAKFIWMALPEAKEFEFSYRIKALPNASGTAKLEGRFSYVESNERKNYDQPALSISFGGSTEPVAQTPANDSAQTGQSEAPFANSQSQVSAARAITAEERGRFTVKVAIAKNNLYGFTRLEEVIPEGYTAISLQSSGAVFRLEEPLLKYVWAELPGEDTVQISYRLLPEVTDAQPVSDVVGTFFYLQNGATQELAVNTTSRPELPKPAITEEQPEEPLAQTTENESEDEAKTEPEKPVDKPSPTPTNRTDKPKETSPKTTTERTETASAKPANKPSGEAGNIVVDIPDPERGVSYRVQIAAGKNNVAVDLFKKQFGFLEPVYLDFEGTWYKYTTGNFGEYKQARDDRERIKTRYPKFDGPFVAAYNEGNRITVQEALLITKQRWYP